MDDRIAVAALVMGLSALVATSDGLYFHLYKYRLYARPECLSEHRTHTIRAVLFGPMVYLLFARDFGGRWLWATVALLAIDFGVQSWDVLIERDSRASLGGLTSLEYWIHVLSVTSHVAAVTLVLASKPAQAWSLAAPSVGAGTWPALAPMVALLLVPSAAGVGALHLWLLQPRYRDAQSAVTGG